MKEHEAERAVGRTDCLIALVAKLPLRHFIYRGKQ